MPADTSPRIVAATPSDIDAIRTLVRAAYAKWIPVIRREPRPMLADHDAAAREHRIDDLLRDGDRRLALIETLQRDDHLWIEHLAVVPEAQGRGYGRLLLAHASKSLPMVAGLNCVC